MTTGVCPFAVWRPTSNHGYGGIAENRPLVFVDHIMGGFKSTMDNHAWLEASGISAHFGIGKDGSISQYVSIFEAAYCQGLVGRTSVNDRRGIDLYNRANPRLAQIEMEAASNWHSAGNNWTLSIGSANAWNIRAISTEHEGQNQNDPWTDAMVEADVAVKRWCNQELVANGYAPIPYSTEGIVGHCDIDHINRPYCPGPGRPLDLIISLLNDQPIEEDDDMASPVWATLKSPPPGTPFRTYELASGPLGMRARYVPDSQQHKALLEAKTAGALKFLTLDTLRAYGADPDPLAP